jgi:hypothetical protein
MMERKSQSQSDYINTPALKMVKAFVYVRVCVHAHHQLFIMVPDKNI